MSYDPKGKTLSTIIFETLLEILNEKSAKKYADLICSRYFTEAGDIHELNKKDDENYPIPNEDIL